MNRPPTTRIPVAAPSTTAATAAATSSSIPTKYRTVPTTNIIPLASVSRSSRPSTAIPFSSNASNLGSAPIRPLRAVQHATAQQQLTAPPAAAAASTCYATQTRDDMNVQYDSNSNTIDDSNTGTNAPVPAETSSSQDESVVSDNEASPPLVPGIARLGSAFGASAARSVRALHVVNQLKFQQQERQALVTELKSKIDRDRAAWSGDDEAVNRMRELLEAKKKEVETVVKETKEEEAAAKVEEKELYDFESELMEERKAMESEGVRMKAYFEQQTKNIKDIVKRNEDTSNDIVKLGPAGAIVIRLMQEEMLGVNKALRDEKKKQKRNA